MKLSKIRALKMISKKAQTLISPHDEFRSYFLDIMTENLICKLVRNSFICEVQFLPDDIQEDFLELKFDITA
jgi:hypothetical protein